MTNLTRLAVAILLINTASNQTSHADPHAASKIVPEARTAWITEKALALKSFQPGQDLKETPWKSSYRADTYVTSCRINISGLLRMGTSEWVYVEMTSSHDHPDVGDVIIAIDSNGNLYQHPGHVCGGIINFRSTDPEIPSTSAEFFRKFTDDVQELPWVPLVIP